MSYSREATTDIYQQIGGAPTLQKLVDVFYPKVYAHPDLAPLFPDGVEEIKKKQFSFLSQLSGGPPLYTQNYGFGNMHQKHIQFEITEKRAKAWLSCMHEAMDEIGLSGPAREDLYSFLYQAAHRFVNTVETENR